MKTVTNEFKEQIKKLGREIDFKIFLYANNKIITENNNFLMTEDNMNLVVQQFNEEEVEQTITSEDIFNVSIVNKGELLSTMMKEIDLEIKQELKIGDVIDCQFGLKVGEEYEYVDYGKYMIYSKEYNEDTKSYNYVAFDRMLLTMQEANQDFLIALSGRTLSDCISAICKRVNLDYNVTQEELETYPNLSKKINEGTFTDIQMTYRDVLDMISQALGLSMIVEGKELKLKKLAEIENKEETIIGKNSLYIENVKEQENIISYSVDGATEQDGTPTPDNPVEVKTIPSIINLFDKNNANILNATINTSNRTITAGSSNRTIYIPCEPNTTYTLYKKSSPNNRVIGYSSTLPTTGTVLSYISTINSNSTTQTITTGENAKYLVVWVWNVGQDSETTFDEMKDSIQIEEGSVAHEYIPYGYWSKVKVTGKNIYNKDDSGNLTNYNLSGTTGAVSSNSSRNTSCFIRIEPSTKYILSGATFASKCFYDSTKTFIRSSSPNNFTTPDNARYMRFAYDNTVDFSNIQLEQGETATTYEPYKENQVLIDMSKENLISTNENGWSQGTFNQGVETSSTIRIRNNDFIPMVKSSYSYTLEDTNYVYQAIICYKNDYTYLSEISGISGKTSGTFNVPTNCSYVRIVMKKSNNGTILPSEIATIKPKFYEGSITPYYELCKIGDYKDTLSIDSSGNCVINKGIGKVVLNGSESWSLRTSSGTKYLYQLSNFTDYLHSENLGGYSNYFNVSVVQGYNTALNNGTGLYLYYNPSSPTSSSLYINSPQTTLANFKTWLGTHNTSLYYVLATPETINLPNTKIPLFEGINHVTFVDDLETDTSITYTSQELADIEEINEQYLKDTNVSFGEKYMINSVVLSRSEDTDTIYRRDEESIAKNGIHEFKIKDNLIMLYDDREDYIDEIFEQLNGLEYYVNDFSSTGITYLDWLDFYNIKVGNKTYKCLMLNDEIKINQGLEETIYTEEPEETVTDYKTSSKTDKEVSFIVDKQNSRIRGQVSKDDIIASLNVAIENGQGIVELKGNTVTIESDDFTLDEDGKISATAGDIGGFLLNNTSFKKELNGIYNYSNDDAILVLNMYLGRLQTGTSIDYVLDYSNDGIIDVFDSVKINRIVQGLDENTRNITGTFEINSNDLKNCIVLKNKDGKITTNIGLGGINTPYIFTDNFACGIYTPSTSGYKGCLINGNDGTISIKDDVTNKETIISAGQIILKDEQGNTKTITASN